MNSRAALQIRRSARAIRIHSQNMHDVAPSMPPPLPGQKPVPVQTSQASAASSAILPARSACRRSACVCLITVQRQRRAIDTVARQPGRLDDGFHRVSQSLAVELGAKHAVEAASSISSSPRACRRRQERSRLSACLLSCLRRVRQACRISLLHAALSARAPQPPGGDRASPTFRQGWWRCGKCLKPDCRRAQPFNLADLVTAGLAGSGESRQT